MNKLKELAHSFSVMDSAIPTESLAVNLRDNAAGAMVTFEGRVRNHNLEREVERLEYQAAGEMASNEFRKIAEETFEKFEILHLQCVHREGMLEIGDCAVWVGVASSHRDAAFSACRYIIDELKSRLPIWKKEHYVDGQSGWINCVTGQPTEPE